MRRFMLRIATVVANKYDYKALFTGDSIGQVMPLLLNLLHLFNLTNAFINKILQALLHMQPC